MTHPIVLSHVTHRLARHFAVRDLSLRVPAGAVYGLLGPNGSGKTTSIRLIMGMTTPDEGTVTVAGHAMPRRAARALADVGYVPERLHLYPTFSVTESMRYHATFYPRWDASYASRLLEEFDLRHDAIVGHLSKGESGKLMVLLALATRPSILVFDEPTDGLDPVARRDVIGAAMGYVADAGATMLITSHLVHELERTCDWVGLLDHGALLIEEPMSSFRDALRRIRVAAAPPSLGALPFALVRRHAGTSRHEEWIVRGFTDASRAMLAAQGMEVLDVQHLDLEDTVVELLRSSRGVPSVEVGP